MESGKIEDLIEKYYQGETNIAEENELRIYFSSLNISQHLEQYKTIFGYLSVAKEEHFKAKITLTSNPIYKKRKVVSILVAAAAVVLIGVGSYALFTFSVTKKTQDLGTYDNPDEAFRATQKALSVLSDNVNIGIESVQYIKEYQTTKDKIFINPKKQPGGF